MADKPKEINYYGNSNVKRLVKKRFIFIAEKIEKKVQAWKDDARLGEKITNYSAEWTIFDSLRTPDKTTPDSTTMQTAVKKVRDNFKSVRDAYTPVYRVADQSMQALLDNVFHVIKEYSKIATEKVEYLITDAPEFVIMMGKQNKKAVAALNIENYLSNITAGLKEYDTALESRNNIEKERNGKFTAQWEVMKVKLESLLNTTVELNKDGRLDTKTGKTVYPYDDLINDYSLCFKQLRNRIDKEEGKNSSSDEKE